MKSTFLGKESSLVQSWTSLERKDIEARPPRNARFHRTTTMRPNIGRSWKKNRLWGLDFVSLDFLLVLLNFGRGYLARISNTKLNMNIWRRMSSNSNQLYTLNKAFLSQHTPYRCTWKYGFGNIDSQYLCLLPTRGRYFMMLANGARGALFWRASHLEEK